MNKNIPIPLPTPIAPIYNYYYFATRVPFPGSRANITQLSQNPLFSTMEPLHIKTPLLESHAMTKLTGFPVYLKLENVQPPGSFKIRGIGNLCQKV